MIRFILLTGVLFVVSANAGPSESMMTAQGSSNEFTRTTLEGEGPPAFEIPWHTIDGGGGTSTGGPFIVSGTIGQPDAGIMTGGGFEVTGGFWAVSNVAFLTGDCERDGDVDLDDYECFQACVVGPGQGLFDGCERFDFDTDNDVDVADYAQFGIQFIGPK